MILSWSIILYQQARPLCACVGIQNGANTLYFLGEREGLVDQLMVGRILEIPEHNMWDRQEIVTRTCSSGMILRCHNDAPGSLLIKLITLPHPRVQSSGAWHIRNCICTCTNVLKIFSALALVAMTINVSTYQPRAWGAEIIVICGYNTNTGRKCINEVTVDNEFVD